MLRSCELQGEREREKGRESGLFSRNVVNGIATSKGPPLSVDACSGAVTTMQPHGSFAILRHGRAINYESIGGPLQATSLLIKRIAFLRDRVSETSNQAKTEAKMQLPTKREILIAVLEISMVLYVLNRKELPSISIIDRVLRSKA